MCMHAFNKHVKQLITLLELFINLHFHVLIITTVQTTQADAYLYSTCMCVQVETCENLLPICYKSGKNYVRSGASRSQCYKPDLSLTLLYT